MFIKIKVLMILVKILQNQQTFHVEMLAHLR